MRYVLALREVDDETISIAQLCPGATQAGLATARALACVVCWMSSVGSLMPTAMPELELLDREKSDDR